MSLGKEFQTLRDKAGSIGDHLLSEAIPCNRRKETAATPLRNIKTQTFSPIHNYQIQTTLYKP